MKRIVLIFLLVSTAAAQDLQSQLEAMVKTHRGKVGFYARNLKTGATVAINADEPAPTASVIKVPILLEAFAQVQAGKRKLSDKITLRKEDQVAGSGVLQFLNSGLELTLEDAASLMMILSDNTGTNLVIDQVTIPAVNARITALGLKNTYLYKKVYKPAEGPVPADQKKFGLGKTTAREMAQVLEAIETCVIKDEQLCRRMIEIMKNQSYRNMVPRFIETADTTEVRSGIAAKWGGLDEVRNEVALVYTKDGVIVISAFTWENADERWVPENEAETLIARLAEAVVKAWSPAGVRTGDK
jgi:beta-lactamase class A